MVDPQWIDADEFATPVPPAKNNKLTLVYTGNIRPAQRIEVFLAGLALARQTIGAATVAKLRFVYRGGVSDRLRGLSHRIGVSDLVDCGGPIARDEALVLQQRADLLLLLSFQGSETEDVYLRSGLYPGKTFEYFGARRPILCVPGDGGLLDELIRETKTGVILATPRAVADYFIHAVAEREHERTMPYHPDEDAVSRYSTQHLTSRLADALNLIVDQAEARQL